MKKKLKKLMTQILMTLLAAAVIVGFVPQIGVPVYAASGDPAMAVGSESVLKAKANTDKAQTVWYANNSWYVISYDDAGNFNILKDGKMTLLSTGFLASSQEFNPVDYTGNRNIYANSALKKTIDNYFNTRFDEKEKKAVENRILEVGEYSAAYPYCYGVSTTETSGYLWPLSTAEACALSSDKLTASSGGHTWWLRSPGYDTGYVAKIQQGNLHAKGSSAAGTGGVRPAFYLDLSSVLFTSAATGGKASGSTGADALNPVGTNTKDDWKLTLLDDGTITGLDGHSNFGVSEFTETETGVSVTYTGATTGTDEFVSAIITDKPITDPSAKVTYYGRVKSCSKAEDTSGTIEIKLADKRNRGDVLYVFNEHFNDNLLTDYASKLIEINITDQYTVTFMDGQGNILKVETVNAGASATAPEVPARDGYIFTCWDRDFRNVNADLTVTAMWKLDSDPTPGPMPLVNSPAMVAAPESALRSTVNSDLAQTIWYAGKPWRVISINNSGNSHLRQDGMMTLLSSGFLATTIPFKADRSLPDKDNYEGSDLQKVVNTLYNNLFSEKEKKAVENRILKVGEFSTNYPYSYGVSGTATSGYLWPLSTAEAYALPSDAFRALGDQWWLRSPGNGDAYPGYVTYNGRVEGWGNNTSLGYGVRPAFYLNLSSVLFTSDITNGKISGDVGADALAPIEKQISSEWKLTLRDDGTITGLNGHSNFGVSGSSETEIGVSVTYTGAMTGTDEYISAIITDKPVTDPSAKVIYYGRVKNCASDGDASGTVEINVEGKRARGEVLYVFNEQCNSSKKTDFASKLVEIDIPEKYNVTFVDGQGNTLKEEVVKEGMSATAPDDPTRDGYTFDGWDTDFSSVNDDLTVTAQWKEIPAPAPEPTPGNDPSPAPGSDPNQKGADGTPVGPGASAAAADRAITNMMTDDDPAGTVFGKLTLKSPKQAKTSIGLSWTQVPGATSYVLYGNKCGKGNKPLKLGTFNGNRQTVSMVNNQKVAKGTYYKFIVVALDKDNKVISTSKVIHVATKGGKVGNHKKVTVKKAVLKKAKKMKAGKSLKLKAKAVPQAKKLKVKKHVGIRYESTNNSVATVSKKGVIKAKAKGTCYIYAYAQNGVFKRITVTVK